LRRGWYWGSQAFADRLLALGQAALKRKRNRRYRAAPEQRAHGEREALRLLKEGLEAASLHPTQLGTLKGSDPRKVAIARIIRQRTTASMPWIAGKLSMRSAANASQQIRRSPQPDKKLPKKLQTWINLSRVAA
jgi:hypothetical protein